MYDERRIWVFCNLRSVSILALAIHRVGFGLEHLIVFLQSRLVVLIQNFFVFCIFYYQLTRYSYNFMVTKSVWVQFSCFRLCFEQRCCFLLVAFRDILSFHVIALFNLSYRNTLVLVYFKTLHYQLL